MKDWKTKGMLALIWVGVVGLVGASAEPEKTIVDWIMMAIHAGLLAGLAVALRHYYKQIRQNALREYRFNLMWAHFVRVHKLDNGDGDHD